MPAFPLALNDLFFCCFKWGRASFTSCTSRTMPLVLLFNFVVHINQIKSSLSQQASTDFFTFLNQAVSSISTSFSLSPQWQLCWRVMSAKLTQQTEYYRPHNQHTHSLLRPSKGLITETWNLLSFSQYATLLWAKRWKRNDSELRAELNLSLPPSISYKNVHQSSLTARQLTCEC